MSLKMECPRCGEIELKPECYGADIECLCECGHYEIHVNPDYDPTPDEEGEPPITWRERASWERPR